MNHKRKRPKHQRAGCLLCKPHKDERVKQRGKTDEERLDADRSAASVERLCAVVRAAVAEFPDWRVGQLLSNAYGSDLFYAENDALAQAVSVFVRARRRGQ